MLATLCLKSWKRSPAGIVFISASSRGSLSVVSRAIGVGNDTDTLGAMAGALSGACLGRGALPGPQLARLEETSKGRAYLEQLAARLYDLHHESSAGA